MPRLRNDSIDAFLALVENEERFELGVISYTYLPTSSKGKPLAEAYAKMCEAGLSGTRARDGEGETVPGIHLRNGLALLCSRGFHRPTP